MPKAVNLLGHVFGRLTVINSAGSYRGRRSWLCRCECGSLSTKSADCLRSGHSRSCGCLQAEVARVNGAGVDGSANVTHGMSTIPEYAVWKTMRQRAKGKGSEKDRVLYSGISCCPEWSDFAHFYADMGPRPSPSHSIDRIDNDGNYEPGNCRWATPVEQAANRRPKGTATERGRKPAHATASGLADASRSL